MVRASDIQGRRGVRRRRRRVLWELTVLCFFCDDGRDARRTVRAVREASAAGQARGELGWGWADRPSAATDDAAQPLGRAMSVRHVARRGGEDAAADPETGPPRRRS